MADTADELEQWAYSGCELGHGTGPALCERAAKDLRALQDEVYRWRAIQANEAIEAGGELSRLRDENKRLKDELEAAAKLALEVLANVKEIHRKLGLS